MGNHPQMAQRLRLVKVQWIVPRADPACEARRDGGVKAMGRAGNQCCDEWLVVVPSLESQQRSAKHGQGLHRCWFLA